MAKTEAILRFTGSCVGRVVLGGKTVSNFGRNCGKGTVDFGKSTLSTVGDVCAIMVPRRRKVGEPTSKLAHAPAALSPAPIPPVTRAEPLEVEAASTPRPKTARRKEAARPKPPRRPKPRSFKKPSSPTPEQVAAAEFSSRTQRVLFEKAVSDLEDPEVDMRVRAAGALGEISHELSSQALSARFFRESSARVRKECVRAMTELERNEGLPTIEHALGDDDASVRLVAVMGVYRLGGVSCATALAEMVRDANAEVRRMVACCIGWLGQHHQAVELTPLLKDQAARVRQAAAEAMGSLGDRRVAPAVIECLRDVDDSVRKKALDAIERITGNRMGDGYPADDEEWERLQARWRHRCKGHVDG